MTSPAMTEIERTLKRGLQSSPKTLPSALLYDDLGSTLFEAITLLPEYGVTRAGMRVLEANKAAITEGGPWELVELGPGAGANAAVLMRACLAHHPVGQFIGVDISQLALRDCARALRVLGEVTVKSIQASYLDGLKRAAEERGPRPWLVAFLGSNLSNFDRPEAEAFFVKVRSHLRAGDRFLIATDLDKHPERLLRAYDDALGVTAAFNKNLLLRLNREYGASFPLDAFVHHAIWNAPKRRMEMHLEAQRPLTIAVPGLGLNIELAAGERIFTESSHRFSVEELKSWGEAAQLRLLSQWSDAAWPLAMTLYQAA